MSGSRALECWLALERRACHRHALIAWREINRILKAGAGPAGFVGQFVGMVKVGVAPDRMIFFDHVAQFRRWPRKFQAAKVLY